MADVVHEEEAYLSCSLSDYDEHADLSTDAEDLADTDSEGSAQRLGIEPTSTSPIWVTREVGKTEAAKAMALGPTSNNELVSCLLN